MKPYLVFLHQLALYEIIEENTGFLQKETGFQLYMKCLEEVLRHAN